ncbi:hypothetical protein CCR95_20345 [Thiocystis minor]|uniref:cysteine-rich CWC family protein n=1 Tax=Thiocystis minor TaxID=61597 RepID=UPI0019132AD5|nr:hypothetical protein [Thiocystis minor]
MENDQIRVCPRCGRSFACKAHRVKLCDCMSVPLNPDALDVIREQYAGCLCPKCLRELNAMVDGACGMAQ